MTARALSEWLGAGFGGGLELRPDLDGIEALAGEREQLWTRLDKATFLTQDEKRAAAGYGAIDGDATISGPLAQKYSPDQPRDEIGRWVDGGGGPGDAADTDEGAGGEDERPRLADPKAPGIYRIDLATEQGHAYRNHVGWSDRQLLEFLRVARFSNAFAEGAKIAQGSFNSLAEANYYVNRILEAHWQEVDDVATRRKLELWLQERFQSPTGREAFRAGIHEEPYIRSTYNVGVLLRYAPNIDKGFRVHTAYPLNQDRN